LWRSENRNNGKPVGKKGCGYRDYTFGLRNSILIVLYKSLPRGIALILLSLSPIEKMADSYSQTIGGIQVFRKFFKVK